MVATRELWAALHKMAARHARVAPPRTLNGRPVAATTCAGAGVEGDAGGRVAGGMCVCEDSVRLMFSGV